MQIFILRHGQAEQQQTTDEARQLTNKGRDEVAVSVRNSLRELSQLQDVWVSPLVRAQQTAAIACEILAKNNIRLSPHTTDLLVPDANPPLLFDALQQSDSKSILLVSHLPLVGDVLDLLCGKASGYHAVSTSALAYVECEIAVPNLGELRWLRHVHE